MSEREPSPSPDDIQADQDWLEATEQAERDVPFTRYELWEEIPCAPRGHERRPGWDDTRTGKQDSCADV